MSEEGLKRYVHYGVHIVDHYVSLPTYAIPLQVTADRGRQTLGFLIPVEKEEEYIKLQEAEEKVVKAIESEEAEG